MKDIGQLRGESAGESARARSGSQRWQDHYSAIAVSKDHVVKAGHEATVRDCFDEAPSPARDLIAGGLQSGSPGAFPPLDGHCHRESASGESVLRLLHPIVPVQSRTWILVTTPARPVACSASADCSARSHKGDKAPIQAGQRWHIERTNAWHNAFDRLQRCDERREIVIDAERFRSTASSYSAPVLPFERGIAE
jgi:hypothetical protein